MTRRVPPRHAAARPSSWHTLTNSLSRSPVRARIRLGSAVLAAAAGCLVPALASATPAVDHNPFGHLDAAVAVAKTGIAVQGWAADPDDLSRSLTVTVSVDGKSAGQVVSNLARRDATIARGAGPKAGFATTVAALSGRHLVCASAVNIGAGQAGPLGCAWVVVPALTAAELAAHSPYGTVERTTVTGSTITMSGWALDPDVPNQPLKMMATVDGKPAGSGSVPGARADVARVHHSGPNQGYALSTVTPNGIHTMCAIATNLAAGANRTLGCAAVRVGPPPLTAAQIAAHSPSGAVEQIAAVATTGVRLTGWASDPDNRAAPVTIAAYLDGVQVLRLPANRARPDLVAARKAGAAAGYSFVLPTRAGSHIACAWAVNFSIGADRFLGCFAVSTPAIAMPAGPTPATPAANKRVTALAAKYLGSRYVWGGADPKTGFDCSGLVQYTYRLGAGIGTPRIAQDQFIAARMITAGRAVPGDLVFFHDNSGSVYHVGIYAGPGLMYAAVDETEGVRYQRIWDPTATFGSFTHG